MREEGSRRDVGVWGYGSESKVTDRGNELLLEHRKFYWKLYVMSTKKYKEKANSNSPTEPNEAVRIATLLL